MDLLLPRVKVPLPQGKLLLPQREVLALPSEVLLLLRGLLRRQRQRQAPRKRLNFLTLVDFKEVREQLQEGHQNRHPSVLQTSGEARRNFLQTRK